MSEEPLKLPTLGRPARRPMQSDGLVEVGRVPPQAIDAEKSVLGCCLISQNALSSAIPLLREESFYHPSHRKIWRAYLDLFERNRPVDLVTVSDYLKSRNELEAIGGAAYLTGAHPKKTFGKDLQAGISMDQYAAARIGGATRFASLEIGCEEGIQGDQR